MVTGYGSIQGINDALNKNDSNLVSECENGLPSFSVPLESKHQARKLWKRFGTAADELSEFSTFRPNERTEITTTYMIQQITAVLLVSLLNYMIAIPFGVSYFPIEWRNSQNVGNEMNNSDDEGLENNENIFSNGGEFPIHGKEALGIRMFLFSTFIGQIAFAYTSGFKNGIGMQMVENVPFCHSLAYICIREQGYGMATLSTVFFLFGLASFIVGIVFFALGHFQFGRIVYFFPSHVLIGCIGGIGFFVIKTGIEVTMNADLKLSIEGLHTCIDKFHLIWIILFFEITLRVLSKVTQDNGKPRYPLLSPIFYCSITPIFYFGLFVFGITNTEAHDYGYFFPSLNDNDVLASAGTTTNNFIPSVFKKDLFDIFTIIDFSTISWTAVIKSIPTMISLVAFSLIHVPINIPAFSISSGVDADMNVELKAHGYGNAIAGLFGGLQNYLCYSNSVLYAQSKGEGIWSALGVAFVTFLLFIFGPSIASFIPRCMAGTLLLHVGIDLLFEGVYDSYGKFDGLEYAGIWLITLVMSIYGMSAALVAGIIAALSVYAAQSITHQNPVRGAMCAKTLRSSRLNRTPDARRILDDDEVGRKKIFVIQLQGHIFFGNAVLLTEKIKDMLHQKLANCDDAWIVILDFTLVLGIDSSAAHAISKLKELMHRKFNVSLALFVTGSNDGFPCSFDLSHDLLSNSSKLIPIASDVDIANESVLLLQQSLSNQSIILSERESILKMKQSRTNSTRFPSSVTEMGRSETPEIPANCICASLDDALIFAEDALIALQDHTLLNSSEKMSLQNISHNNRGHWSLMEETECALHYLKNLCPGESRAVVQKLHALMKRNAWKQNDIIWRQNSEGSNLHLLLYGSLLSVLEEEAGTTESINPGAMFGELGLISGMDRLSTVKVMSHEAVTMSLDKEDWEKYVKKDLDLSRCLYMISIRYMSHRLQHVSNRIFETRCLPI